MGSETKGDIGMLDEVTQIPIETMHNEDAKKLYLSKSLAVQNQIQQWEKLVEISIHFEKCVQIANVLPNSNTFNNFEQKEEFKSNINETADTCKLLLENMLELQNCNKSKISETPIKSKTDYKETRVQATFENIQKNFENYRPYRNEILQKWLGRTYVANDKFNLNVNKKIEDLMANKNNLIIRSRTLNQHYTQKLIPFLREENQSKLVSPEIYDDTEFYFSLLQEIIQSKSNSGDKTNIKDKLNILNLVRQNMKRTVGKKASKGRKIRFTVHNKLVNFMPMNESFKFEDSQRNVLFQSLFSS